MPPPMNHPPHLASPRQQQVYSYVVYIANHVESTAEQLTVTAVLKVPGYEPEMSRIWVLYVLTTRDSCVEDGGKH